jgi:type IV pilus assembly protein PilB
LATETYSASCWNCLGEFDAMGAVWCSDDSKNPTKLCPFCFRCFCDASERYKTEFWRHAPSRLHEELQVLSRSKDRLGDVLLRMKKITTPQLLDALVEQRETGERLGEILVARGLVKNEDIQSALRGAGANPLMDTTGVAYAAKPVWEQSDPRGIIDYILGLATRKGASDVQIEPKEEAVNVKYRIDGFFFKVDPIPKRFQQDVTQKLFDMFRLDAGQERRPQLKKIVQRVGPSDYDLVVQTLPTAHGVSATIKLVNRTTFMKDFATLGLEVEDRVRLVEELRGAFGLVLVTAPVFNGANTTLYSVMNFLVQAQRDVVTVEAPVLWPVEGARQVSVDLDAGGRVDDTLRSVIAVRPEALLVSSVPDRASAMIAAQLATSVLVVLEMPASSAAQAVTTFLELGAPPNQVSNALAAAINQRLVRQICRICRVPAEAPAPQTLAYHGLGPEEAAQMKFFRGKGCPSCNKVGYRGRRAVFEVLTGVPEVRAGVLNGLPAEELQNLAVGAGMKTLRERCLQLVRDGVTTFDEFVRLRL